MISKIFMNRTEDKIDKQLSQSQSAYRKKRSTTDIVWAYRWIVAKTQKEELEVFSTGIDMSSAFDTIHRDKVINICQQILNEDEIRILRLLLSETTLEIQIKDATKSPFQSNIGSPQGDSISGPMFTLYLNESLEEIKNEIRKVPINVIRNQ